MFQGSVLGLPTPFNVLVNYIFYALEYTDIFNFSDCTTPYSNCIDLNEAITNNEYLNHVHDNYIALSASKYHLTVTVYKD